MCLLCMSVGCSLVVCNRTLEMYPLCWPFLTCSVDCVVSRTVIQLITCYFATSDLN